MAANPLPDLDPLPRRSFRFPVRGQVYSGIMTCPNCMAVIRFQQLNRREGLHRCLHCLTAVRLGLSVQILPDSAFAGQIKPSDYTVNGRVQALLAARLRSRTRRRQVLHDLGLADPMPLAVEMPWAPGAPINSVEVIADPALNPKEPETS